MPKAAYASAQYRAARAACLAGGPLCVHCERRPATVADHQPPLVSVPPGVQWEGLLVPSCATCSSEQGGHLSRARRNHDPVEPEPEAVGVDAGDAAWDVPWLDDLRDVPPNAVWPRYMTVPHGRAVGSLADRFVPWAEEQRGRPLRWWQRLFATRLLEVDDDGCLVWEEALLTLARQLGKTYLVGDLCSWRFEGGHFAGEQLVLSTGKDLAVVKEMHRTFRVRAKSVGAPYKVREVNGQEEIEVLGVGSRWMVRAKTAVYGLTASMATVDEAWNVQQAVIDDGLVPTMAAVDEPQMLLLSTAHRQATRLVLDRRSVALDSLRDPAAEMLLLEWSAPRSADLADRAGWRSASPHWDRRRERLVERALLRAESGESDDPDEPDPVESFRAQWLNQWPLRPQRLGRGEALLEPRVWAARDMRLEFDSSPAWVSVEDNHGRGGATAVVVRRVDGYVEVGGWRCDSWDEVMRWAVKLCELHPSSTVLCGASLLVDRTAFPDGTSFRKAGRVETAAGLPLLRAAVADGWVVHDDTPDLDDQVAAARVVKSTSGLSLLADRRSDLLRGALWGLVAATRPPADPDIT